MKHYHILRAHVREPDPRAAPARNIFREDLYTSRIWVGWVGGSKLRRRYPGRAGRVFRRCDLAYRADAEVAASRAPLLLEAGVRWILSIRRMRQTGNARIRVALRREIGNTALLRNGGRCASGKTS